MTTSTENGARGLRGFHELTRFRVRRILLVSSLYDSFIMSEEGQLQETLLGQFLALNLSHFPDLVRVSNAAEAIQLLDAEPDFDLVIASASSGGPDVIGLTAAMRAGGHQMPVVALTYSGQALRRLLARADSHLIEHVFLWQGDVRIFLAIIKSVEDRRNVAIDTGRHGVPIVLVVEDNIRFYSSFLPVIYTEVMRHVQHMLDEDLSLSQRLLRMRARPKVLLCQTYEAAWNYVELFGEHILGVISDFEFPKEGKLDKRAGLDLVKRVLGERSDICVVLQSSEESNRALASEAGGSFLLKGSPTMLNDLRSILTERFGFGAFIFRGSDGAEITRATDLRSFGEELRSVTPESLVYHATRNHFSLWLKARTEFELADRLRPRSVDSYPSVEAMREHILELLESSRKERNRTFIADFEGKHFEPTVSITRVGAGGLGGKARGVAFANRILQQLDIDGRFPDVDVSVPASIVLGTEAFDQFLEYEWLREFAIGEHPDQVILERFLDAPFPREVAADLRAFLLKVHYPLAVRSSSLLEDSLAQPFAGVYRTYFLPNNDPSLDVRLNQLKDAIRGVYASAFSGQAKRYLEITSFRLEEEKMAVMIQAVVGQQHHDLFYPDFSGVARSHNFYPEPGHRPEDGVAAVALGMGRTVVDGRPCVRFCPKYPQQLLGFSSVKASLESSQREFFALDLRRSGERGAVLGLVSQPLEVAESDGVLRWLGSTWCADDDRIIDGISRPGVRLVSFAQVLKHGAFPLAEILSALLEGCSEGTGAPVEIEFAGSLARDGRPAQLGFLQMRPLTVSKEHDVVELDELDLDQALCHSKSVLGNGLVGDLYDVVVVPAEGFDRSRTTEIALEVARYDAQLRNEGRPYVLVGVGRWGSADPFLGIPVTWNQISGAAAIVEAGFEDMRVEPSQGTHFFQNLTASHSFYFTVNPAYGEGRLDWDWLASQQAVSETDFVRHLRLDQPLTMTVDGRAGEGVISKA